MDDRTADADLVRDAAEQVLDMTFAELCNEIERSAHEVGPDTPGAAFQAWAAYQHVEDRMPIAEAIADRFENELHAPLAPEDQTAWPRDPREIGTVAPFEALSNVYRSGEFPLAALRSCGLPKPEIVAIGAGALENVGLQPVTYTAPTDLPEFDVARVFEIHRPSDWFSLCNRYPQPGLGPSTWTWALPGPYAEETGHARLMELDNQFAATDSVVDHICPSWESTAEAFDAVHLSWAGFITAEGYVSTRGRKTTMLRYWEREVTLWLNPISGGPRFVASPLNQSLT